MSHNVLVIVAHPDDEVLACGGTIAKHALNGDSVVVAILGEGKSSRKRVGALGRGLRKEIITLRNESVNANKILGVREVIYHNFPDNALDAMPLLRIIQYVEQLKQRYAPDIVYTHHHSDINIDHQLIFKAVVTAFRPVKDDYVPYIYTCEVPSATEWQAPIISTGFQPNVYIDIASTLDVKKRALSAYRSELRTYPHPRCVESIDIIARRHGIVVGFNAAEPFVLIRNVRKNIIDSPRFVLRRANENDKDTILTWRNNKIARAMSENQHPISAKEHASWFKARLSDCNCRIYIAIGDLDSKYGIIRFDRHKKNSSAQVSLNIAPEHRGKGLGKFILRQGVDAYLKEFSDTHAVFAVIKNDNFISEHIFTKCGFRGRKSASIPGFYKLTYINSQEY